MAIRNHLSELRRRRRSVRPEEMHDVLIESGFQRRGWEGPVWVYTHPLRQFPLTIDPRRNPLLPTYVARATRAIEEVLPDEDV